VIHIFLDFYVELCSIKNTLIEDRMCKVTITFLTVF
jgi:hypothetical protein